MPSLINQNVETDEVKDFVKIENIFIEYIDNWMLSLSVDDLSERLMAKWTVALSL